MPHHPDIVVVGASAGGVEALRKFVSTLPSGLDAAIFVVLHILPTVESLLPELLARDSLLSVLHASDGALIETGKIYVAPPDRHILLYPNSIRVVRSPKENRHRPSIDVLFRSAAEVFRSRVVGVLLSGADSDGTAGLRTIQQAGGKTIVQDPQDCIYPQMPASALRAVRPDFTVPVAELGGLVKDLVGGKMAKRKKPLTAAFPAGSVGPHGLPGEMESLGPPSAFSCPDCDGTLWEQAEGESLTYRCRVGHAYTSGGIVEAQSDAVEGALWSAVRMLEESASLMRRLAPRTAEQSEELNQKAAEREQYARTIRELILNSGT